MRIKMSRVVFALDYSEELEGSCDIVPMFGLDSVGKDLYSYKLCFLSHPRY